MIKKFTIKTKEPYKFTAKSTGKEYDKCRYSTDSDALDLFDTTFEVGQTYELESYETSKNGRIYTNWKLTKPKGELEKRVEILEKKVADLEIGGIEEDPPTPEDLSFLNSDL